MNFNLYWIDDSQTNDITYKNRKYRLKKELIHGSYRIDLIEDEFDSVSENTANDTFKDSFGDINEDINSLIIMWGCNKLLNDIGICDCCKEEKLIMTLNKYELEDNSFPGIKQCCKECRYKLYSIRSKEIEKARYEESLPYINSLKEKPPIIIGGFSKRIDALQVLNSLGNDEVEEIEDGFILAKGIIKFNDGTYYPAFLTISLSDGGELWEEHFVVENYDELISGGFAKPYLNKSNEQIYPYEYETLSYLEEDFHQHGWIKSARILGIKSHFMNYISRPEFIDEEGPIKTRTYFSIQHLLSAVYLARQSKLIEQLNTSDISEDDFVNHRSLVTSSLLAAASFLEATINEFYSDAFDNRNGIVRELEDNVVMLLSNMWKLNIPKTAQYSILNKYQIALTLTGNDTFDISKQPYQNLELLVKLRNALIHYEPEWINIKTKEGQIDKVHKFEKLFSNKFELNPLTGINNPFFPDKCLGFGIARWAITSCLQFTDEFFNRLGLLPTYNHIRSRIKIETL